MSTSSMPKANVWRKVNVIGHINPDTDSICSAIAYAYLKNQASEMVLASPAVPVSSTGRPSSCSSISMWSRPASATDVSPQIKDIDIRQQARH